MANQLAWERGLIDINDEVTQEAYIRISGAIKADKALERMIAKLSKGYGRG